MEIEFIEEVQLANSDWRLTFELDEEARAAFVAIGLKHTLIKSAEFIEKESEDN